MLLIKSGEALEKMGKVDTIAFDKTGTLTYGKLQVSDIITFVNEVTENELLAIGCLSRVKKASIRSERLSFLALKKKKFSYPIA